MYKKSYGALKILKSACSKKSQPIKKDTYFFVIFLFYIKTKWLIKNVYFFQMNKLKGLQSTGCSLRFEIK